MSRETGYTVLLIEADTSLRRLIALGLKHRGMQVTEINSLAALADQPIANPDLLVLDIDSGYRDDSSLLVAIQEHPYLSTLPTVVLAWDQEQQAGQSHASPLLEVLAKPFDARLLYTTIENLLVTSASISMAARRGIALAAPASTIPSASFSPFFTAVGLLLLVIGLMLSQLLVVSAGLLIVLIGLLCWTLTRRPERQIMLGDIGQHYSPSLR